MSSDEDEIGGTCTVAARKDESSWATSLVQYLQNNRQTSIVTNNKRSRKAAVSEWMRTTYPDLRAQSVIDLIFIDLTITKAVAAVFGTISSDTFADVLDVLLEKCNTNDELNYLCAICSERCTIASTTSTETFIKFFDYYRYFTECCGKSRRDGITLSIVDIDYRIDNNTKLHNDNDLIRFSDRIEKLFEWFGDDTTKNYECFLAPYFALIQSSGTGKTLLLDKYKQQSNQSNDIRCMLLNCGDVKSERHTKFTYQRTTLVPNQVEDTDIGLQRRTHFWECLEELIPDKLCRGGKIVLLFDEANHLLENDAKYFRSLRWWLRQKRADGVQIVAVLTGTSSQLANPYPERKGLTSTSRGWVQLGADDLEFYNDSNDDSNLICYNPFLDLTTMGCMVEVNEQSLDGPTTTGSDYVVAATYGRPLLAILQQDMLLNDSKRYAILIRMLFGKRGNNYTTDASTVMNILGTRVQMGRVSDGMATKLVADGYAHLVSYRQRQSNLRLDLDEEEDFVVDSGNYSVDISYLPDPVCAHLAMCLMDKNWELNDIIGQEPIFWTNKAEELFSSGICHPYEGDIAKVASALFLLFCGDAARKKLDNNYIQFTVDLTSYVEQLVTNNSNVSKMVATSEELIASASKTSNTATSRAGGFKSLCDYQVSFIQIARPRLRTVELRDLCSVSMLGRLYKSANAIYLPPQIRLFDILASIKCTNNDHNEVEFIPLFFSVKSSRTFDSGDVANEFAKIKSELNDAQIQRALCLVIVLDLNDDYVDINRLYSLDERSLESDLNSIPIVCKVLVIHENDSYGINKLVQNTGVGDTTKQCEVYSNHWVIPTLPAYLWEKPPDDRYEGEAWDYAKEHVAQSSEPSIITGWLQQKQNSDSNKKRVRSDKITSS